MKELRCKKCNKYLGEIEKGRIEKGAVIYCKQCNSILELAKQLQEQSLKTAKDIFGEKAGDKAVDNLMDMFNIK